MDRDEFIRYCLSQLDSLEQGLDASLDWYERHLA